MNKIKSLFEFNKQERSGVFFLLLLIVLLLGIYYSLKFFTKTDEGSFRFDEKTQARIDSIKKVSKQKDSIKIFPFNPNYVTDYKGYTLGMSAQEIDRLHSFRAQKKFVNSTEEFQKVTGVSDSLLNVISPYFKFPDWVNSNQTKTFKNAKEEFEDRIEISDLNSASEEDLKTINGIGKVLSTRIVKFRNRLGGFLVDEQLYDVYGLEPHIADRVTKRFKVLNPPDVKKINVNTANAQELSSLVYISYQLAQNIVRYRNTNGFFKDLNDLLKISGYPSNKNERIKLYLSI